MTRRGLDVLFSVGGIALALLLVVLGLVLTNRADFATKYVKDQLSQQDVAFPAKAALGDKEMAFTQSRTGCVLTFAGQNVTTGKQAECYANEYLGAHLTFLATRLGMTQVAYVDGMNYRALGAEQAKLKKDITAAQEAKSPDVSTLQQRLTDVTTVRQKMFEGTMLRNALLTSYGFGSLGTMAGQAALVCFIIAGVLFLLAIAGLFHAARVRPTFAVPTEPSATVPDRLAHV